MIPFKMNVVAIAAVSYDLISRVLNKRRPLE